VRVRRLGIPHLSHKIYNNITWRQASCGLAASRASQTLSQRTSACGLLGDCDASTRSKGEEGRQTRSTRSKRDPWRPAGPAYLEPATRRRGSHDCNPWPLPPPWVAPAYAACGPPGGAGGSGCPWEPCKSRSCKCMMFEGWQAGFGVSDAGQPEAARAVQLSRKNEAWARGAAKTACRLASGVCIRVRGKDEIAVTAGP
jgi:hypothetical protein